MKLEPFLSTFEGCFLQLLRVKSRVEFGTCETSQNPMSFFRIFGASPFGRRSNNSLAREGRPNVTWFEKSVEGAEAFDRAFRLHNRGYVGGPGARTASPQLGRSVRARKQLGPAFAATVTHARQQQHVFCINPARYG